jgi:ATP-dependent protease ClpP protease subunit
MSDKLIIENVHDYCIIPETREIFIHGYDTDDSGTDHRVCCTFIKNLRILESQSNKPIVIHQYNIGGEWSSGMGMFDAIKQSKCSFVFICHGVAASMGSIIPQAVLGKGYRVTHKNCDWLIHDGFLYLEGIPTQTKSNLDYQELNKQTMYDIYTDSCLQGEFFNGNNRSKVKAFLKRKVREKTDWCLSGEDAVKYGFADAVFGEPGWETIDLIKKDL